MSGDTPLMHIYEGDEGGKFLRGEPGAVAICGFVASGPGTPTPEWCDACRTKAGMSLNVEHW